MTVESSKSESGGFQCEKNELDEVKEISKDKFESGECNQESSDEESDSSVQLMNQEDRERLTVLDKIKSSLMCARSRKISKEGKNKRRNKKRRQSMKLKQRQKKQNQDLFARVLEEVRRQRETQTPPSSDQGK
jgi:hypothetical protein